MQTRQSLIEIARANVELHLGDVAGEYEDLEQGLDAIHDEAYTLAFDALVDHGIDHSTARDIAKEVAHDYAQP